MSSEALFDIMRHKAAGVVNGKLTTSFGVITGYNPAIYSVKLDLQPGGESTGWIPLISPWVGNDWGFYAAPPIGAVGVVAFMDGDATSMVCIGWVYNSSFRPLNVPSGEMWMVNSSGSMLKFHGNGDVDLAAAGNINITAAGAGTATASSWAFHGPATFSDPATFQSPATFNQTITVTGMATVGGLASTGGGSSTIAGSLAVTGSVTAQGTNVHTHTHTAPNGGGTTSPPN